MDVLAASKRILLKLTKLCNIDSLYNDLKWEHLSSRRKKHKLFIFYKMFHGVSQTYLSDLIPTNNQNRYNLRNTSNIPYIHARTQLVNTGSQLKVAAVAAVADAVAVTGPTC